MQQHRLMQLLQSILWSSVRESLTRYSLIYIDTAGSKDFTPRSQHAMAYDSAKDVVYIMGGTSLQSTYSWDLLKYTFATNKWDKIALNTKSPDPRYGHYAFMHNSDLYVYGGVSNIGGLADVWKYNGTVWTQRQPTNPEKLPAGRIGSACVVVTKNNSTKLYVFGGLNSAGVTTRDLNVYDINLAMWTKSDHQNSIGLSGATAVYHQATDSIYYFGGMVNQTTRNVLTYQYRISQDLWYALAPRIDPLTATPTPYWDGSNPDSSPTFNMTDGDPEDDTGTVDMQNRTSQYLPPVMYDSVTAVWAPAGLMGDDSVVMFGGMRPYGPGLSEKDQFCFSRSFALYDLSCQKWTTYDAPDLDAAIKGRVNHTMILRPPGAPGGSKTAWTAYIFGGFDGTDHADMLNVTIDVPTQTSAVVNSCRALRWCSHYDDCQNCNPSFCSYVNGLCMFDTDKAKGSNYLLGSSADVPKTGTIQDLIRQRPDLKSQVLTAPDGCPTRIALDLDSAYSGTIQSEQEMTFKVYMDAHDLDIRFEIRTLPSSLLDFKTLNVWEGFMNMYWRADHGLTDDSWNGYSGVASPIPLDVPMISDNSTVGDNPVITPAGTLNTSELMNRWTRYTGLDASPSSSAIRLTDSYVDFWANDSRRFSGYYVFSLTNRNPTALSLAVTVMLVDHPASIDKEPKTQFNMTTLGFFMLGFILAVILLIFMARKIRQLIDDRDASHRAAEMQLLEDEEEERNRNGGRFHGGMARIQMDGRTLIKKPIYRIVVAVQHSKEQGAVFSESTLRYRVVPGDSPNARKEEGINKHIPQSRSEWVVPQAVDSEEGLGPEKRRLRVRSDYIRDIGYAPSPPSANGELLIDADQSLLHESGRMGDFCHMSVSTPDLGRELVSEDMQDAKAGIGESTVLKESTTTSDKHRGKLEQQKDIIKDSTAPQSAGQGETLGRGWSLKRLSRAASSRSQKKPSNSNSEERAGLTSQELKEDDEQGSRASSGSYDSGREMVDFSVLSAPTDVLQLRQEQLERHQREQEKARVMAAQHRRRRNPLKIQPLSIEPLPFHAGLVPRTMSNLRRYQKHLARQQQRQQQKEQQQGQRQGSGGSFYSSTAATSGTGTQGRGHRPIANRSQSNSNTMRSTTSMNRPPFRNHPTTSSLSAVQRARPRQIRATQSQGSLREVRRVASRMTLKTNAEALLNDPEVRRSRSYAERSLAQEELKQTGGSFPGAEIELRDLSTLRAIEHHEANASLGISADQAREEKAPQRTATAISKRKAIKMRGRQEYEPGPLLGMNYLIVFPGDAETRKVREQGDLWRSKSTGVQGQDTGTDAGAEENEDILYDTELRLPPMAIGTVFVPDPVRWWTYKAKQVLERRKFERQMDRQDRLKAKHQQQQNKYLQLPQAAKTRR
ncbi:hypothetical protein BC939DRAFT_233276 [Gamsiella multidivaricata]|uniref:uncharacterized protein n=1 Tax=Gamsiella multidivaricata TaxID=101098 RepID=UPI00221EA4B0|nr:uncharacterized protein BC939DRAFT_233276 [Gamsiella multidivaricata]KAI7820393.1 hypothetical protein BC939DRAFT_233276 [Gamsiella multidivaricata]